MIGSTNLSTGGGVGSDELTATSANVLEGTTYVGSDTDDELAEGTMQHLTNRATIKHTSDNTTKVILGDAAFVSKNSDGITRAEIRYNGTKGFITPNTLFSVNQGTMATAGGLTAAKIAQNQSAFGIGGTFSSDATASASQISSGAIAYVKGSKVTGTLVERGQAQYGNYGSGSDYVAINALPEGIYRSNGASWAPEARISYASLRNGIGLSADKIKKGVSILGITGTWEGYASDNLYLFNNGTWSGLSTTGVTYLGIRGGSSYTSCFDSANGYVSGSNIVFCARGNGKNNDNGYPEVRLNTSVNLTGYKYIKFHYNSASTGSNTGTYNIWCIVYPSAQSYVYVNGGTASAYVNLGGYGILDISALSGSYWIYLTGGFSSNYNKNGSISYQYVNQIILSKQ